ncbi:hypothetical protein EDB85DRAFT_710629 [Lactarius pseudohatsudake]|nr:hypothetical protein EDB85DRAFT_710629 [Lactarius pseudohatsudake]
MGSEQESSLFSIIPAYYLEAVSLSRLQDTELLARLHANFWRSSMEAEESAWHKTQLENKSMNMDVDGHPGGSDEIDPGCFVLHIGIPGIEKVWIRKEYIELYNCCEEYLKGDLQEILAVSVVITGHIGIGKSYWILYALRRRLSEGKPVIWYRDSTRFLFVNEGVYKVPKDFLSTDFSIRVWTLVDSDEIPPELAVHQSQHLNIFTTLPQAERWKPLERTTDCAVFFMNPWTKKEILQAAVIHGFTSSDHQQINTMYDRFGPTPRICFDFLKSEAGLVEYETRYQLALESLSLKQLREMIFDAYFLNLTAESQTLLLLKRVPEKRLQEANLKVNSVFKYAYYSVEPVTHAVEVALWNQLRQEKPVDQFKFYSYLAGAEATRHIAGLIFKSMAHSRLQERIALDLFPMVKKRTSGSDQGELPQWHSTHKSTERHASVLPEFSIDIQPARVDRVSRF